MGVTDVVQLGVSSELQNEIEHGGEVFQSDVLKCVVKELLSVFVVIGIKGDVAAGVDDASCIAHPYIVPRISKGVSWRKKNCFCNIA